MPNPASTSDIEARWRALSEQEAINAETFLEDAWDLLLTKRPTLETDLTAGTVREGNVVRVVASMVLRVLRNPDGKVQESIDDYSYRRSEVTASGALFVTGDELADITPGRQRNRSVRLVTLGDS